MLSLCVRTTIFLDDNLAKQFKAAAHQRGQSLSAFLAEAGRASLNQKREPRRPFKLVVFPGDGLAADLDLNQTSRLIASDDVSAYRSDDSQ